MCKCTPNIRTPFCGKPGCEDPNDIVYRLRNRDRNSADLHDEVSAACNEIERLRKEVSTLLVSGAMSKIVKPMMRGERLGWNNALHWAADWIKNAIIGETNERTIEFAKNMAVSMRAAKRPEYKDS